jgi:hypothetical protein
LSVRSVSEGDVKRLLLVSLALLTLAAPLVAQYANPAPRDAIVSRLGGELGPRYADPADDKLPVPKLADGTPDFSGVWRDGGNDPRAELMDPLLMPWAKQVLASRKPEQNPYFQCMPAGPLRMSGGMAWRFVQPADGKRMFWLYEGNVHSYRQIFTDGRKHPEDPDPTYFGHSIGHWEGNTLVVDTIGLNDKWWMDQRGTPHTEQMHIVEKWTRTSHNNLRRVVTIDDPGTFTKPFEYTAIAKLTVPDSEILEYFCQENNQYGIAGGLTK